jgi:hypothetical protein
MVDRQMAGLLMLWYKAWHESKARFLYVLAGMVVLSGLLVFSHNSWGPLPALINYHGFIFHAIYFRFFHAAWVFSTLFLALGGLLAERHQGTALFTLSLPVRRRSMLLARAGMGAAQAFATAIIPSMSVSLFSLLAGHTYPLIQTVEFALLLVAGGLAFFSLGLLLSIMLAVDWAPLAVGIPMIAAVYTFTRRQPGLRAYNPQDLFTGVAHLRLPMWAIGSPLPWTAIAVSMGIALILLLLSIVIAERLEF